MYAHRLLFTQLIAAIVLAVFTWAAFTYFLFWRFWWFDIPMHLLGGFWAALFVAWLTVRHTNTFSLPLCLVFALSVGILWEIFEYSEGIAYAYHMEYPTDTFKDITMDLLGGILGWTFVRFLVPGKKNSASES